MQPLQECPEGCLHLHATSGFRHARVCIYVYSHVTCICLYAYMACYTLFSQVRTASEQLTSGAVVTDTAHDELH